MSDPNLALKSEQRARVIRAIGLLSDLVAADKWAEAETAAARLCVAISVIKVQRGFDREFEEGLAVAIRNGYVEVGVVDGIRVATLTEKGKAAKFAVPGVG